MLRHAIRLSVSVATFIFGLALSAVPSLFASGAIPANALERQVIDANQEYLEAYTRRDVDALDQLLAEEFTVKGRHGRYDSKSRRLASVADSDLEYITVESVSENVTADDTEGSVSGHAVVRGVYAGREFSSPPYRFTRRFVMREGRWQLTTVEVYRVGW